MYAWKFHRRDKFVIQSVTGGYGNIWSAWTNFVSSWRRAPIRNLFRHSIYSRIPPVTDCITNNIALCTFNIMSIAFTHKWKFTVNATHPVIYMRFFFTLTSPTLLFHQECVWGNKTRWTPPLFIEVPYQVSRLDSLVYMCNRYQFYLCFHDLLIIFWVWRYGICFNLNFIVDTCR